MRTAGPQRCVLPQQNTVRLTDKAARQWDRLRISNAPKKAVFFQYKITIPYYIKSTGNARENAAITRDCGGYNIMHRMADAAGVKFVVFAAAAA